MKNSTRNLQEWEARWSLFICHCQYPTQKLSSKQWPLIYVQDYHPRHPRLMTVLFMVIFVQVALTKLIGYKRVCPGAPRLSCEPAGCQVSSATQSPEKLRVGNVSWSQAPQGGVPQPGCNDTASPRQEPPRWFPMTSASPFDSLSPSSSLYEVSSFDPQLKKKSIIYHSLRTQVWEEANTRVQISQLSDKIYFFPQQFFVPSPNLMI